MSHRFWHSKRHLSGVALATAVLMIAGLGCMRGPEPPSGIVDSTSLRTLSLGEIVGSTGRFGHQEWRGIPFATPPVGALRWRAPQPPQPWKGTREALADPAVCMQVATPGGGADGADAGETTGSEDCLYVNVFAPTFAPAEVPAEGARLPVMFWIHGGGNSVGDISMYNGGLLAQKYGVIVVATQYRLGPFGWLRHKSLRAMDAEDAGRSGNFGTLDLIRSLEFVRDEIAAFGGDPNNVTIFGESAGGSDVISLMLADSAAGLFHRAIVESGSGTLTSPEVAENFLSDASPGHRASSNEVALTLLLNEGSADTRAEARELLDGMDDGETSRFLRGRSAAEVFAAYKGGGLGMLNMPKLFADGDVLPASTLDAFAAGDYHRVPVIFGTNRDETKLFQIGDSDLVNLRFGFYPRVKEWDDYNKTAEYRSKLWKSVGVDELARRARAQQGPSVYAYRFDWDEEPTRLFLDFSELFGAAHGIEVFFVFGDFEVGLMGIPFFSGDNEAGRVQLSDTMMSYWANFARTGSPASGVTGDLPEWAVWDESSAETPRLMLLDSEEGGGVRMIAETVTKETVIAEVAIDERFVDDAERCGFLRGSRRGYILESDLEELCAEVPLPEAAPAI